MVFCFPAIPVGRPPLQQTDQGRPKNQKKGAAIVEKVHLDSFEFTLEATGRFEGVLKMLDMINMDSK